MTGKSDDDHKAKDLLEWLGIASAPDWSRARTLGGIFGVVLVLIFLAALLAACAVLFGTIRDVFSDNPAGPNLGAGALITALLGAPFLIWATVIKHRSLGFQKEGHLTDRISKAVEQLGAEKTVKRDDKEWSEANIEVRIGGILSLERIAQDSTAYDKGRDHVRCMEILCAYIRENAPASAAKDHPFGEWEPLKDDPTEAERAAHLAKRKERLGRNWIESKVWKWAHAQYEQPADHPSEPRADVALALRVIGRRDAKQRLAEARWGKGADASSEWVFDTDCPALPDEKDDTATTAAALATYRDELRAWKTKIAVYKGYRIDLRKTNLQRADLSDLILSGARLNDARLEGANLQQVRMEGANLGGARMEGANLRLARTKGANLGGARLEGAYLRLARMEGAYLGGAQMQGASLGEARMDGANLRLALMEGANLWLARMQGANLSDARMQGAYLGEARMQGVDFWRARMEGADLSGARMEGAALWSVRMDSGTAFRPETLQGAGLRGVDFSMLSISPDDVRLAFGDASVILPNGITPASPDWPAHWPTLKLALGDFNSEYRKWQADPSAYIPPLSALPRAAPPL